MKRLVRHSALPLALTGTELAALVRALIRGAKGEKPPHKPRLLKRALRPPCATSSLLLRAARLNLTIVGPSVSPLVGMSVIDDSKVCDDFLSYTGTPSPFRMPPVPNAPENESEPPGEEIGRDEIEPDVLVILVGQRSAGGSGPSLDALEGPSTPTQTGTAPPSVSTGSGEFARGISGKV